MGSPAIFLPLFAKGEGFHEGIRMWLGGVTKGKKAAKIEVSEAKICTSIGRYIRGCEIQWQVKG